jgi:ribosomal-protein-alanine N-acetyltransferase
MAIIFSTSRLLVRQLNTSDSDKFHELQGNQNVMEYTSEPAMSQEESEVDLLSVISKYDTPNNPFWVWAIVNRTNQNLLGTCALVHEANGIYEIGYRLLESEWRNGFGGEVTNGLIDFAFETWNANEIIAFVDKRNVASIKILERSKLNFIRYFWNSETETQDFEFRLKTR